MVFGRFRKSQDVQEPKDTGQIQDIDLSETVTVGDRLAFRTCSAIDGIKRTQYFYVAHFNPDHGSYEKRRVDYPLTQDEVNVLKEYGIKGLQASDEEKRLKIDNRFARAAAKGYRQTGFFEMVKDLLYYDDEAQTGHKNRIAIPEELRRKELEILGTFHIRSYLIEEGFIASIPSTITHQSDIIPLAELQSNAFDPRIVTDIDKEEWAYAGQRINGAKPPKPIYVEAPYDDISVADYDSFLQRTPFTPIQRETSPLPVHKPTPLPDLLDEPEADEQAEITPSRPRLSKADQKWIFEALLTEAKDRMHSLEYTMKDKDIGRLTPQWIKLLKEYHDFELRLEDLADENGPLGTLFYASAGQRTNKYAAEALPALADYFAEKGTPIPYNALFSTKMDDYTLYDRLQDINDEFMWHHPARLAEKIKQLESGKLKINLPKPV